MAYPVFCSTCGKHVGNVMDKARQNDVFYCRTHGLAPHPSTTSAKPLSAQDATFDDAQSVAQGADTSSANDPKAAEPATANKRRMPKQNK